MTQKILNQQVPNDADVVHFQFQAHGFTNHMKLYEIVVNGGRLNAVAPLLSEPNQPKYLVWLA